MKTKHAGNVSEAETKLKKGPVYRLLTDDHARLDLLLQRAFADPDQIDLQAYSEFRSGLLKHIAMEEKVLLPAAQQARDGEPLPIAAKLRIQHGALTALLVPSPISAIGAAIRAILKDHNPLEEGSGGVRGLRKIGGLRSRHHAGQAAVVCGNQAGAAQRWAAGYRVHTARHGQSRP